MNLYNVADNLFREELYQLIPLQEEASSRRYFLVERDNQRAQVLCKDYQINWDFINLSQFLIDQEFNVPKVISVDSTNNTILQEFCGIKDLSSLSQVEYEKILPSLLDLIIRLQDLNPPEFVKSRSFDYEKLMTEVDLTVQSFNFWKENFDIKTDLQNELYVFLDETCGFLNKHPDRVFAHRDFHCRNVLIHPDNSEFFLIDFQDARMGTPQYDLSSILYDAYKPLPIEVRISLLDDFILKTKDKKYFRFRETFYLQALQRSFKALGTYLIQVGMKKNNKFKPSLLSCLDNIMEISQLGHLPDSVYVFSHQFSKELKLNL